MITLFIISNLKTQCVNNNNDKNKAHTLHTLAHNGYPNTFLGFKLILNKQQHIYISKQMTHVQLKNEYVVFHSH